MATYFASDFHLGLNNPTSSKEREKIILNWLDDIKANCESLFLLGDIFDYWYEYKEVIPKGYVRLLGKLASFVDDGIPVHLFTGNHDLWMFGYLEEEIGLTLYKKADIFNIGEKVFFIGHGDGLGPGDHGYKVVKKVFSSRFNQWLFSILHPNLGLRIMRFFSKRSREAEDDVEYLGRDKEWLIQYAERKLEEKEIDYFIFGHRHLPLDITLSNGKSRYINTGDWINHFSYAVFENGILSLKKYQQDV